MINGQPLLQGQDVLRSGMSLVKSQLSGKMGQFGEKCGKVEEYKGDPTGKMEEENGEKWGGIGDGKWGVIGKWAELGGNGEATMGSGVVENGDGHGIYYDLWDVYWKLP